MRFVKIRNGITKIFRSSWTITILSTMIGVFAGIFLNGLFKESNLNRQSRIAMDKIEQEITSNEQIIVGNYKENMKYFEITKFIFENMNTDGDLILTSVDMAQFRLKYPDVLANIDSLKVKNDIYKYSGELNFDLNPPSLTISNIAWITFKNSQLTSNTSYECLYYLEVIDNLQDELIKENATMLKYFMGQSEKGEKGALFIAQYQLLLDIEKVLINSYKSHKEVLKKCA